MSEEIYVNLEFTPNPNTLKFSVNRTFLERGAANFLEPSQAAKSPLAKKIFGIEGVQALLIGTHFITVTKAAEGSWDILADQVPKTIEDHLLRGEPVFDKDWKPQADKTGPTSEIEKKICQILDSEIRPAVAMDGGDITFERYDQGIVYLYLQGACSSCPSAIATLKNGVEERLKAQIPEIKEVVQI